MRACAVKHMTLGQTGAPVVRSVKRAEMLRKEGEGLVEFHMERALQL